MSKKTTSAKSAPPQKRNLELVGYGYVILLGEDKDEGLTMFATSTDATSYTIEGAKSFDTYNDAFKWMVTNCEVEDWRTPPEYPTVKAFRTYQEVIDPSAV